jgi:GrpB-like predicted nucleotidyltransferase (UPF0157 family)
MLPAVERILASLTQRLSAILPDAELYHVGGTAVPGAITKGDIDVALRVPAARFATAVGILGMHFAIKQRENWTPEFASFGDDVSYELPVGIQVAIRDSVADSLLYLRDYLIANRQALAEYNSLKLAHAKSGQTAYWQAKHEFFAQILSDRTK